MATNNRDQIHYLTRIVTLLESSEERIPQYMVDLLINIIRECDQCEDPLILAYSNGADSPPDQLLLKCLKRLDYEVQIQKDQLVDIYTFIPDEYYCFNVLSEEEESKLEEASTASLQNPGNKSRYFNGGPKGDASFGKHLGYREVTVDGGHIASIDRCLSTVITVIH